LFRLYRVTLRPRAGDRTTARYIEVRARTQGAARRSALQANPGYVVDAVERIDE
jgi:hypothetical protein